MRTAVLIAIFVTAACTTGTVTALPSPFNFGQVLNNAKEALNTAATSAKQKITDGLGNVLKTGAHEANNTGKCDHHFIQTSLDTLTARFKPSNSNVNSSLESKRSEFSNIMGMFPANVFPNATVFDPENSVNLHPLLRYGVYNGMEYCSSKEDVEKVSGYIDAKTGKMLFTGNFVIDHWQKVSGMAKLFGLFGEDKDLLYYIARSDSLKEIVLVFRGSSNFNNMVANANINRVRVADLQKDLRYNNPQLPKSSTCRLPSSLRSHSDDEDLGFYVKQGFFDSMNPTVTREIISNLLSVTKKYSDYKLVVTGHSLGGALASLFAPIWNTAEPLKKVDALITYAQPITGSLLFNNWISECVGKDRYIRVVSSNDVVPWANFNDDADQTKVFAHSDYAQEVFFPSVDRFTDFRVCRGGRNASCSMGIPCEKRSWDNHMNLGRLWMTDGICLLGKGK